MWVTVKTRKVQKMHRINLSKLWNTGEEKWIKKLTIKESFNLGKGWNLMIFAILAMLVTNAGVNDGLNIALQK